MAKKHHSNRIDNRPVRVHHSDARSHLYNLRKNIRPIYTVSTYSPPMRRSTRVGGFIRPSTQLLSRSRKVFVNRNNPFRDLATKQVLQHAFICARRKTRREVIFAHGRGGGSHTRNPKFNRHSQVQC